MNQIGIARLTCVLAGLELIGAGTAYAYDFQTDTVSGSLVSSITLGTSRRAQGQNSDLLGTPGSGGFFNATQTANRGDANYNKGDWFAQYLKGNHELLLKFPDSWKFMVRGAWLYDWKADDTRYAPLADDAKKAVARDVRLLDLWVSKDFTLNDQSARVRVGNQVVSWGESLFIPGGINQTNALDQQRLTMPGVPLKEVVLPAPMVSFATGLGKGVNVEGYYQVQWNRNKQVPAGTYFSAGNYVGKGRVPVWFGVAGAGTYDPINAGVSDGQAASGDPACGGAFTFTAPNGCQFGAPFLNDQRPKNGGQWGISAHWKPTGIELDLGAYYLRYHEKNPYLQYVPTTDLATGYNSQWAYPQNLDLYGLSTNFGLGGWSFGLELSYRPKDPILVDPFSCGQAGTKGCDNAADSLGLTANGGRTYDEAKRYQLHGTWWRTVNPSEPGGALIRWLGAQASTVQGEVVMVRYPGIKNNGYYNGLRTYADLSTNCGPGQTVNCDHFGSRTSWGYVAYFDMTYDSTLIPGWQVTPNITFAGGVKGDTPNANYTWFEGNRSVAIGVLITKNPPVWQFNAVYVNYNGGLPTYVRNYWKDRDWWGVTVTRNF